MDIVFLVYIAIGTGVGWIVGTIIFALYLGNKCEDGLTLHKLSKDKVNEEGLYWLVAVRDTVDWFDIEEKVAKYAIIKKGEIVWTDKPEYYKYRLDNENGAIHPFKNKYCEQYRPDDFRELTPEEKRKYLK